MEGLSAREGQVITGIIFTLDILGGRNEFRFSKILVGILFITHFERNFEGGIQLPAKMLRAEVV